MTVTRLPQSCFVQQRIQPFNQIAHSVCLEISLHIGGWLTSDLAGLPGLRNHGDMEWCFVVCHAGGCKTAADHEEICQLGDTSQWRAARVRGYICFAVTASALFVKLYLFLFLFLW